ncbi:hypothetical protein ON010_g924 [Phytophthora cinnamomi]|nr:hypothetical protein ON010_g924 [Phytophthora cinnamomi]
MCTFLEGAAVTAAAVAGEVRADVALALHSKDGALVADVLVVRVHAPLPLERLRGCLLVREGPLRFAHALAPRLRRPRAPQHGTIHTTAATQQQRQYAHQDETDRHAAACADPKWIRTEWLQRLFKITLAKLRFDTDKHNHEREQGGREAAPGDRDPGAGGAGDGQDVQGLPAAQLRRPQGHPQEAQPRGQPVAPRHPAPGAHGAAGLAAQQGRLPQDVHPELQGRAHRGQLADARAPHVQALRRSDGPDDADPFNPPTENRFAQPLIYPSPHFRCGRHVAERIVKSILL